MSVTYDGGEKYINVPVDTSNLLFSGDSTTELKKGSYYISTTKTAFVYGGKVSGNNKVPVTLVYTNDMGANWITCEIDENSGVMAVGYDKNEQQQSSRIYSTTDGGETWNTVGAGPATNIIKGIKYIDEKIGFFCYDYVDGMDSNLYMTSDSGKTFSKIILEPQELDSTGAVLAKVAATPGAIGYVSLDVVDKTVAALKLDGVDATEDNIKAGKYTLSRPFVMATKGSVSSQSELVQTWFNFVKSDAGKKVIKGVGLILPE